MCYIINTKICDNTWKCSCDLHNYITSWSSYILCITIDDLLYACRNHEHYDKLMLLSIKYCRYVNWGWSLSRISISMFNRYLL